LIYSSIEHSLTEFDHPSVISLLSLGFPTNRVGPYAPGFQSLIFDLAKRVICSLLDLDSTCSTGALPLKGTASVNKYSSSSINSINFD